MDNKKKNKERVKKKIKGRIEKRSDKCEVGQHAANGIQNKGGKKKREQQKILNKNYEPA